MQKGKLPLQPESDAGPSESSAPNQLSCIQCRNRKLKCDRQWPACDRCLKQNEPCVYPGSRQRAIGRRKTVRELEERIGGLRPYMNAFVPTGNF